jgi:sulfoxide reductase heme-binding subunit YedZ
LKHPASAGCVYSFLTFVWLDQFFDWKDIAKDIGKRPFVMLGFAAFVLPIPLAATSANAMVKRLGTWRWQWLPASVDLRALGARRGAFLVAKKDVSEPLVFAVLLAALFIIRLLYLLVQQRSRPAAAAARSPGRLNRRRLARR